MNPIDDKTIRQRLKAELGALEISPVPVIAVRRRGKAIRARRRAVAGGFAAVAVVAVLAVRAVQVPAPAPVTINPPGPGAPGGMFASGTAHGKPWRLAVRNVDADPGTPWCLPAVMLNGHDGAILGVAMPHPYHILDGGVLTDPPGQPSAGFGFQEWPANVIRVVYRFPGGQHLTQRPVAVVMCGRRFLMSGYSFTRPGTLRLTVYTRHGHTDTHFPLPDPAQPWPPGSLPGLWSVGSSVPNTGGVIGSGTDGGSSWTIKQTLGLAGQCYIGALRAPARSTNYGRTGYGHGQSTECVPVAAPPRTTSLSWLPVSAGTMNITGYAGLVNPRARALVVSIDNGTTDTVHPVNIAGRAYVAFVVPPGCEVTQLVLRFAHHATTITTLPPAK